MQVQFTIYLNHIDQDLIYTVEIRNVPEPVILSGYLAHPFLASIVCNEIIIRR